MCLCVKYIKRSLKKVENSAADNFVIVSAYLCMSYVHVFECVCVYMRIMIQIKCLLKNLNFDIQKRSMSVHVLAYVCVNE